MEEPKVDQELVLRAPDLSRGGDMNGGKVKEKVVLLAEVEEEVNQERKKKKNLTRKKLTQEMEVPENQSENAFVEGNGDEEVAGNLLDDGFDDLGEREDDENYFPDGDGIGSEVLADGVDQEKMEQENATQEAGAPETLSENAIMERSGDEEADENPHEDEMVEENHDDPEETADDEDYFPDEDSIGSEEEATSGLSDEEYTPTPARTVKPLKRKLVTVQPPVEEELSEYEKIRAANIKQRKEFLQTLQGDWQEYKEDEGLVAGKKSAKKSTVVERGAVVTKTRASIGKNYAVNEESEKPNSLDQPAVQVSKKREKAMKRCRAVLMNCKECGEEVRKTLLKMHIKFYHPKIQNPRLSRVRKKAGTSLAPTGKVLSTWENQKLNAGQQLLSAVEKTPTIAPSAVGARIEKQCRVDSLFANVKVSPLPHTIAQKATHSMPTKSLTILSNFSHHTSLAPQPIMVSPYAARANQAVALPFAVNKALPPATCVKGVMRKPPTPLLPAPTLDNSVRSVYVKGPLKVKKDTLIPNNVEADARMAVGEGRAQKEGIDSKHTESESGSEFLPLNYEFTQDNSVAERGKQTTKCRLCGDFVPAGLQFLQLHEELYPRKSLSWIKLIIYIHTSCCPVDIYTM